MKLPRSRRPGLFVLGIAALTAAASAVPRDSGAQVPDPALALRAHRASEAPATMAHDILPQRNPFADDPGIVTRATVSGLTLRAPGAGPDVNLSGDPARDAANARDGSGPRVTATVTGARPFAIIVDANGSQIVTVGDVLAGQAIAAIDASGVRLANGTTLALSPAHDTPPPRRMDTSPMATAVPMSTKEDVRP